MTPKEKAIELLQRFTFDCRECDYIDNAKQSALICIDELIKENKSILVMLEVHGTPRNRFPLIDRIKELEQVKKEIELI